jgi:hypothetical protein
MFRRIIVAIAAVVVFGISFGPTVATADRYKWCAVLGNGMDGARDCGYLTIEQCRATISGIGGDCELNQFYTGPDEKPAKRARKRHHN